MATIVQLQHVSVPMPPGGQEAARTFYGGILGLQEKTPPSSLAQQQLVWFSAGAGGQEVHVFADDGMEHNSSAQHLCLQFSSLSELRDRLSVAGIAIEETTAIHNRPRCFIHDPFGNLVEVTEVLGEYD